MQCHIKHRPITGWRRRGQAARLTLSVRCVMRFWEVMFRLGRRWSDCCRHGLPLACIILALCQVGCAVIPKYPSQLSALTPAQKKFGVCPVITGRYADKGSAFSPKGKPLGQVSLSQLLHKYDRQRDDGLKNADVVVVIGPANGILELQSWHGGQQLATMQRRDVYPYADTGTYLGNKGFVCLALHAEHGGAAGIGIYASEESLWLRKAVDGSLIVLHRDLGFGLLVFAPFWGCSNKWLF